jgi:ABC-type sulfate transport system permease component
MLFKNSDAEFRFSLSKNILAAFICAICCNWRAYVMRFQLPNRLIFAVFFANHPNALPGAVQSINLLQLISKPSE